MLIRSKRSKKSQDEQNRNRNASTEGQEREKHATDLQASVQGGLSEMVRQSPDGTLEEAQVENWLTGLEEQSDAATSKAPTTLNPKIVKRFVMRGGKLTQING